MRVERNFGATRVKRGRDLRAQITRVGRRLEKEIQFSFCSVPTTCELLTELVPLLQDRENPEHRFWAFSGAEP